MIGQATSLLAPRSRRWLQRVWGCPEIHTRQKWLAVWPSLARLPEKGIRLLDAGCGSGLWALELAARRPGWTIVGVDFSESAIRSAEEARQRLGLTNVAFLNADFIEFEPKQPFDAMLSVLSAHYLAEANQGEELFHRFRSWLKPDGRLFLLGPRRKGEAPLIPWLAQPPWHEVFSAQQLADLCSVSAFSVDSLRGYVGRLGTLAKQISWAAERRSALLAAGLYPLQWLMGSIGARTGSDSKQPTMLWLLIARAAPPSPTQPEPGRQTGLSSTLRP